jgi:DUF4097 and DUF4098 domain-containing protein YvlB
MIWLVVIGVGLLGGCGFPPIMPDMQPLHEATRTLIVEHESESALQVQTTNGSVSVEKDDRQDVEIVARLKATSPERLEATKIVAQRTEEGALDVHIDWADGKRQNREGCSFEIRLPDADGVHLRSSNGKLSAKGLAGPADLGTSNGAIEVHQHNGSLTVRTSNGKIVAKGVQGDLELNSSNGPIEATDALAAVQAKTSNGPLKIGLAPESPGPIKLDTSNGPVSVDLGPAFVGQLKMTTSNGPIKADNLPGARLLSSDKNRLELAFGDSEQESSIRTSNGPIDVSKREPQPE